MNWRIKIGFFLLIFSACTSENKGESEKENRGEEPTISNYLIEVDEFKRMVNQPNIRLLDFRKKEDYEIGHIKGALSIWRTDIEDRSYPYTGMMASPEQVESLFSNLGIASTDTIIVYDDNGLCNAARLWWILQNYDFTNIKLFEGGLTEWAAKGGLLSKDSPVLQKKVFKLPENPSMKYYVSKEDMEQAIKTNTVILDTRSLDEFTGKLQKKGAVKAGRIINSVHIDWAEAINFHGNKKIKTLEALESIYGQLQIGKEDPIIVYCHSGVRSAHTTFILTQLLNYKNVKNYDGSWTEWSYYNDLPFEIVDLTQTNN
jgi:thiosulfate/3-mercaptopyruvate sulfurtransferase